MRRKVLEDRTMCRLSGDLRQLKVQKSWQFEVGTRGRCGPRPSWDVSAYDIELWDEIRNVNVQPFPGAPFTLPRYENIDRSCHTGIAVGADLLLLSDLARRLGFATGSDTLGWRNAYTWSRFVFVDNPTFGGNDLPGALEHYIRSEFRYDHPVGLWVASNLEWAPTSYFVNSENTSRACPLAVDADGRAVIVGEDSTAMRRRILLRYTTDGRESSRERMVAGSPQD